MSSRRYVISGTSLVRSPVLSRRRYLVRGFFIYVLFDAFMYGVRPFLRSLFH